MARWMHDDRMERSMASRLDRSKERARREMFHRLRENQPEVAKRVAMKLIEDQLIETTSKRDLESQLIAAIDHLIEGDEFEINYAIAPYREVVPRPNLIVLYLTSYVVEKLINQDWVEDIFGSDEQIYQAIRSQVEPLLTRRGQSS